jgi:hypothetical protein
MTGANNTTEPFMKVANIPTRRRCICHEVLRKSRDIRRKRPNVEYSTLKVEREHSRTRARAEPGTGALQCVLSDGILRGF